MNNPSSPPDYSGGPDPYYRGGGPQNTPSSPGEPYPPGERPAPSTRVALQHPSGPPYVTYALLAVTILIYLLQEASGFLFQGVDYPTLLGMKINEAIVHGEYWRLITPVFLHAGILHIGFNMYALYVLGPGLERYFGHTRFLVLYFLSGFAGNVASFMLSAAPSVGASTAIFGLIGAEAVFVYQNQRLFAGRARQILQQIIMIAVINLLIGLSPGIDNWGHIGGLVAGVAFAWFGGPVYHLENPSPFSSGYNRPGAGEAPAQGIQGPVVATLVDGREGREVLVSALSVGLVFVILAGVTIFSRGG